MDQINTAIDSAEQFSLLARFGISKTKNEHGLLQWTINVSGSSAHSAPRKAHFDPQSQRWILDDRLTLEDANRPVSTLPKTSSGSSQLASSNGHKTTSFSTASSPAGFLSKVDWRSTALGMITVWPLALHFHADVCIAETRPNLVLWGSQKTVLYNEAAILLLGSKHPDLMGRSALKHWPALMEKFASVFDNLEHSQVGQIVHDLSLCLDRHGYAEETWWSVDVLPLKDDSGLIAGFSLRWLETTRQTISDRRGRIVDQIGKAVDKVGTDVWTHLHQVLQDHPYDFPMSIVYAVESVDGNYYKLRREAVSGTRSIYQAAPQHMDLKEYSENFGPFLRRIIANKQEYTLLDASLDGIPTPIFNDIDWQGHREASKYIAIIPLFAFNNVLKGFIIVGLNPRLAMDGDHRQFLLNLGRRSATVMTSVTDKEQSKIREAKLMKDLIESEKRIRRMAELAPMGMYDLSPDGPLLWANEHFYDILGAEGDKRKLENFSWVDFIHPDSIAAANEKMTRSVLEQIAISDTLQLRKTWYPPHISGDQTGKLDVEHAWILYEAYPHIENGLVTSIMGCITDISQFKWAESVQARSAEAAKAAKERLEEFIDITSHEMRNPLSAVTQCADDILLSIQDAEAVTGANRSILAHLHQISDTAKSIALCASHQRRIIDDILTLSKLDSGLLTVVPTLFRPQVLMTDAMRMFAAEFISSGIRIDIVDMTTPVFEGHEVAYCDATRLMQILVNLITNAIKFTRAEDLREVVIKYGASQIPPDKHDFGQHFAWSVTNRKREDLMADEQYGDETPVYFWFSVQDTGQGLPSSEAVHIFDKFVQANRRTYIKYGGSGLGLFISRELIELQNGKIGVASEVGEGSTFAFYVKAKRAVGPKALAYVREHAIDYRRARNQGVPAKRSSMSGLSLSETQQASSDDDSIQPDIKIARLEAHPLPEKPETGYHILLVEDNLVNQRILAKQLRRAGFDLVVANHGGEAVDHLLCANRLPSQYGTVLSAVEHNLKPFDCILMDWEMPILDGLSATAKIRELEVQGTISSKHIIVGVTANARAEQIQLAMNAGMDEVVVKPFRVQDLVDKIIARIQIR